MYERGIKWQRRRILTNLMKHLWHPPKSRVCFQISMHTKWMMKRQTRSLCGFKINKHHWRCWICLVHYKVSISHRKVWSSHCRLDPVLKVARTLRIRIPDPFIQRYRLKRRRSRWFWINIISIIAPTTGTQSSIKRIKMTRAKVILICLTRRTSMWTTITTVDLAAKNWKEVFVTLMKIQINNVAYLWI